MRGPSQPGGSDPVNRRQLIILTFVIALSGAWWMMLPSSDPLKYFNEGIVQSLAVTADGKPLPDSIQSDSNFTIVVRFTKPDLPRGREYHGLILLRNSRGQYPKPPEMPLILVRVREVGQPRETLMAKIGDAAVDVTPPPRPSGDTECYYVGFFNAANLPKGVVLTSPIDLHIWIYERDDARLLSGEMNGAPDQSILIYKKTLQIH